MNYRDFSNEDQGFMSCCLRIIEIIEKLLLYRICYYIIHKILLVAGSVVLMNLALFWQWRRSWPRSISRSHWRKGPGSTGETRWKKEKEQEKGWLVRDYQNKSVISEFQYIRIISVYGRSVCVNFVGTLIHEFTSTKNLLHDISLSGKYNKCN